MPTKLLLIKGYTNDEYLDDIPYLAVDLDASILKEWRKRINTVKTLREKDSDVYCLTFWEARGDFFHLYDLEAHVPDNLREEVEALVHRLEKETTVILDPDTTLRAYVEAELENTRFDTDEGARIRTEMDMLDVYDNGVVRCANIRHTNARVETTTISTDDLDRLLEKC